METNRDQGVLSFQIKGTYKLGIAGDAETSNEITCYGPDSSCEDAAFLLEQKLMVAMNSIQSEGTTSKKQMIKDEKDDAAFYADNSPSIQEIDKRAQALQMGILVNKDVELPEILNVFKSFINAKKIQCCKGLQMTGPIWNSISRADKLSIIFRYVSFFVNPLETLQVMGSSVDKRD